MLNRLSASYIFLLFRQFEATLLQSNAIKHQNEKVNIGLIHYYDQFAAIYTFQNYQLAYWIRGETIVPAFKTRSIQ